MAEKVSEELVELTEVTPQPQFRDRMTVVEHIYHQPTKGEAFCCETTFERILHDEESVFSRRSKVTEEWKPIDLGWIVEDGKQVGMLVIRNDEGKNIQRLPSDEEKIKLSKKVLDIGIQGTAVFCIPPGETMRGVPSREQLYIRCLGGECFYTVFVFPN